MNILPNSDIQSTTDRVYLNNKDSGTELFYTSNFDEQYYFLMREEEVIASGVMKGYKEGTEYNYRFDFANFIKIYNQDIKPHTTLDSFGSYRFEGDNTCSLYLYISNIERIESNIFNGVLIEDEDGTVRLNSAEFTYEDIVHNSKSLVTFVDGAITDYDTLGYELQYRVETAPVVERGGYMPITLYRNNILQYEFIDENDSTIFKSDYIRKGFENPTPGLNDGYILTESDGFTLSEIENFIALEDGMLDLSDRIGYMVVMLKIPNDCKILKLDLYTKESTATNLPSLDRNTKKTLLFEATDKCHTPYYFWNDNGAYDTIYCSGVANKVVDVDKTYINLNGKQMPIKIEYQESIKHNTGLSLKQEQIYSLIKSPQVDMITEGPVHNIYNIELESFEGYNGINLSDRNIELILSKPRKSRRVTNKTITFFD